MFRSFKCLQYRQRRHGDRFLFISCTVCHQCHVYYGDLTITGSIILPTAVESGLPITVKLVACENIIIAKFKMLEIVLPAQECGILCSNLGASRTIPEVSLIHMYEMTISGQKHIDWTRVRLLTRKVAIDTPRPVATSVASNLDLSLSPMSSADWL